MSAPIIHKEFPQHRSDSTPDPRWREIKAGKWSASNAATIMSKIGDRGGMTKSLQDLIKTVAWERVYGATGEPNYQSAAMERGLELENDARDWYVFTHDVEISEVGFVEHATLDHVGWSPDGLFDDDTSGIEIKCLLHKAWMDVKKSGEVPSEHRWQCRWAMWVGQLDALDFIAYHPQAGGLVVPWTVTDETKQKMAARVALLETHVAKWISILEDQT